MIEGFPGGGGQEEEITPIDCWTVIDAYFAEKGLVGQQLDSFNEFIQNTIQEIVDDDSRIVHQTSAQHTGMEDDVTVRLSKTIFFHSNLSNIGLIRCPCCGVFTFRVLSFCAPFNYWRY